MTGLRDDFPDLPHVDFSHKCGLVRSKMTCVESSRQNKKIHRSARTHRAFQTICIWDNLIQGNVRPPLKYIAFQHIEAVYHHILLIKAK
jgi:hypothetical protein